jgi:hypothetical protein
LSQLARLLCTYGPGHVLSHAGKEYVFRLVDQARKAELEAALFRRQREAVYAMKAELSPEEYDRALQRASDAYARGEYAAASEAARAWFFGEQGFPSLVCVLCGCTLAEAEALIEERETEAAHVALCVWFASMPALKKKLLEAERRGLLPARQLEQMARLLTPSCVTTPPPSPRPASGRESSPA